MNYLNYKIYMYKLGTLFLLVTLASAAEPYYKVVHNTDK